MESFPNLPPPPKKPVKFSGPPIGVRKASGPAVTDATPASEADSAQIPLNYDSELIAGEYVTDSPIQFRGKAITLRAPEGPEQTVIRMAETPADPALGSIVVFASSEDEGTVLEGFTLTGGQGVRWGNEPSQQRGGGGDG